MPERAHDAPKRLSDLRTELQQLDQLISQCEASDRERLRTLSPELQGQLQVVAEMASEFARALGLWADPETQSNLLAPEEQIASGKPLAGVPIDQVIAEIERRRTDLGA